MTSRKTSSSKSPKKSSNNSTGVKVHASTGTSKTKASSSLKSKTQSNLKKNTTTLTTGTPLKKRTSKTTSKKQTQLKILNSRKLEMFPYLQTFPIFLKNETENKRCWFCCIEHAQKYIDRYKPKYKCYQYTGKQPIT